MLNRKIKTWVDLSKVLDRAEVTFEKKSGWKSKEVKTTLSKISRLNLVNQALFGGLLVGRAIFKGGKNVAKA